MTALCWIGADAQLAVYSSLLSFQIAYNVVPLHLPCTPEHFDHGMGLGEIADTVVLRDIKKMPSIDRC